MKKVFLLISVLLFSALALLAKNDKLSPLTRVLLEEKKSQQSELCDYRIFQIKKNESIEYVSAFIHFKEDVDIELMNLYGVKVQSVFDDMKIITADVPVSSFMPLAELSDIEYIEIATSVSMMMDQARGASNVDMVHEGYKNTIQAYKGKNVLVGIVDYGFQFDHINFKDQEGNLRIKKVWNQNDSKGEKPSDFSYGSEYKTEQEIVDAKYDDRYVDDTGHGTHVAGIAAGSYMESPYYGVAPESNLIIVSADLTNQASLINSIKYIFDYADEVGLPCVVNYSLGSHVGPHDGSSTFDTLCNKLQGEGRLIVGAAGNEGGSKLHVSKVMNESDSLMRTFINFSDINGNGITDASEKVSYFQLWGDKDKNFLFSIVLYSKKEKKIVYRSEPISASESTTNTYRAFSHIDDGSNLIDGYGNRIIVASGLNKQNNKPSVTVTAQLPDMVYPLEFGIEVTTKDGAVHGWTEGSLSEFTNNKVSGWVNGDDAYTVGETGGTGDRIITVGSYTSRERDGYMQEIGELSTFSSKGPTVDGRIKPEITAPGAVIISSVPNNKKVIENYGFDKAASYEIEGETYYYGYMQGTSMAAPYVTGVLATWLEADPKLSPEKVREVFEETAIQKEGVTYPNNEWGYGKIDAMNGLFYILGKPTALEPNRAQGATLIYPNPTEGEFSLAFTSTDNDVMVYIYNTSGQLIYSEKINSVEQGTIHNMSLYNVPNGAYIVKILSEKNNETYRLIVNK